MPTLHAVQHHAGYIDRGYIPLLARTFNLSVAEVHGVITFYKDFRTTPPKGPIVQVCRAEACTARGGQAVERGRSNWVGRPNPSRSRKSSASGCSPQGPAVATGGELLVGVDAASVETIIGHAVRRRAGTGIDRQHRRRHHRLRPPRRCSPCCRCRRCRRSTRRQRWREGRPQRLARHALAGAAGRGRDRPGPHRLWPGRGRGRGGAVRGRADGGRRPPAAARRDRGARLDEAPAAPDLRPRRDHRPALAGRLSRPWRAGRVAGGPGAATGADRRGGRDIGPARPRRRRLPDRDQVEDRAGGAGRAEIYRLQCRRGRQRHLRRPHADGGRSLPADRGHDHRRVAVGANEGYIYLRAEYPAGACRR